MADEAALAAGLFAPEVAAAVEEPHMNMAAQMPGGATLAAAASAMVAGIAEAMSRPARSLEQPASAEPVTAIADRLEDSEAERAGLWAHETVQEALPPATPAPEPAPVTALSDHLDPAEAEAAGLWSPQPLAPQESGETDFPAETVDAMKAVAAGIAAGLTGGVVGGVVSAPERDQYESAANPDEDDTPPVEGTDTPSHEEAAPPPEHHDLSRPERLTFQEIARRLGTRIVRREDGSDDKGSGRLSLVSDDDNATNPAPGDVIMLSPQGGDETVSEAAPVLEEGGRVLPFTRSEPNAERMVLDRLPLGIVIYTDDAILYANRAALDLAGLDSVQALKALGSIDRLFANGTEDGLNAGEDHAGTMTIMRPDGTRVAVSGRLQRVRWENQSAALISLREETAAAPASNAREASPAEGAVEGANASDGALPSGARAHR
jgi:PAS domain-containing protein